MKNIYRKKIGILFILFFAVSTIFSQTMPMKDKFYIGYVGSYYANSLWNSYFPGLQGLNINFIQGYGEHYEYGSNLDGGFTDPIDFYQDNVNRLLNTYGTTFNNNATIMEREKVLRGAFGQMSDYQAEELPTSALPQYGYANRYGTPFTETINGETITSLYTGLPDNTEHILVSNLIENQEQINIPKLYPPKQKWDIFYYYSDIKTSDYKWFVMPRMKISHADAFGTEQPVCRIDIVHYDGAISSIVLSTSDFRLPDSTYDGRYIDLYYRLGTLIPLNIYAIDLNNGNTSGTDGKSLHPELSQVDYRITWYGKVELWLDRVRVADEWAFYLFHPELEPTPKHYDFVNKIHDECTYIGGNTRFGYFYIDEYMYNSLPCIAEVNRLIRQNNQNSGIIAESNISLIGKYSGLKDTLHVNEVFESLVSSQAVKDILYTYVYPFTGKETTPNNFSLMPLPPNVNLPPVWRYPGTEYYYKSVNSQDYNDTINHWLENDFNSGYGYNYCLIDHFRRAANLQKNHPEITFCAGNQSHSYETPFYQYPFGICREPTNEEIRLQSYLSMAYGAKIILNYWYNTFTSGTDNLYDWGMENDDHSLRNTNYYNQRKYDTVKNLNANLQKIGKIMYEDNNFIWDNSNTVDKNGFPFKYFTNLKSYFRNTSSNWDCNSPFEDVLKYWEIGVFNNNSSVNDYKYFILVNKRCTPEISKDGDVRQVKLYFDANQLTNFNNWSLKDLATNNVAFFDKNNTNGVLFPYDILPGEGKLFQLAPVMSTGGTLAGDESFSCSVNCYADVFNNNYNITLGSNAKIYFAENATILMTGGNFVVGSSGDNNPHSIEFNKQSGSNPWRGLMLTDCNLVNIYSAIFNNVKKDNFAVNMTDCNNYVIENNSFVCNSGDNSGGIDAYFGLPVDVSDNICHYMRNNSFDFDMSETPALQVLCVAGNGGDLYIINNHFNYDGQKHSSVAINLDGVVHGIVNSNIIYNFDKGIIELASNCDFYLNTISSNNENSTGIKACISRNNHGPSYAYLTGGNNHISNTGTNSDNIRVEDSYFNIQDGMNIFNINSANTPYHIDGYFPAGANNYYEAGGNCFKDNSAISLPLINVTQGSTGSGITFNTNPTNCIPDNPGDYDVFSIGGGLYDTIYLRTGGGSGGFSNDQLSMYNVQLKEPKLNAENENEKLNDELKVLEIQSGYKNLRDSINFCFRIRDFVTTEQKCKVLLTNYPDSSESIGAISKLYLSSLSLDSSGNHITAIKSFYEALILNNSGNTDLIKKANYFVQKCKAALKQYTSALQGFQEIINQNPYSFEGLIASWDYAAVLLLANSGGGFSNVQLKEQNALTFEPSNILTFKRFSPFTFRVSESSVLLSSNDMLDSLRNKKTNITSYTNDNYDKKIFSKKDREIININVQKSYIDNRSKQIAKVQDLENKSKSKNETERNNAKKDLKTMKTLGEVVKVKKPKDIKEHIFNINSDIKKVFENDKISGKKDAKTIIPTEYKLYQNFPNPFNPMTKINYDLPKDAKVTLIIYDILGREMKRLVNNEFKSAGKYSIEFNGQPFASGVYFYRLVSEKYVEVKKMVLIK